MSFTPENTADSAMNSASNAFAISRAMVVLPEPGGPHGSSNAACRLEGEAQRLARPKMTLADHLVERLRPQDLGKRTAGSRLPNRSLTFPLGRRRLLEARSGTPTYRPSGCAAGWKTEGAWSGRNGRFHRTQVLRIESHAHALEPGLALARSCLEPLQAILRAGVESSNAFSMSADPASSAGVEPSAFESLRTVTWLRSRS